MATWQYTIHLIPHGAVVKHYGLKPNKISREDFDTVPWWENQNLPGYDHCFDSILPRRVAWHEQLHGWGSDGGHRIDVWFGPKGVAEILVRVDVRADRSSFLASIVRFAKQYDLLIVTEDMDLREPNVQQLRLDIIRSAAARFIDDPEHYLEHEIDHFETEPDGQ